MPSKIKPWLWFAWWMITSLWLAVKCGFRYWQRERPYRKLAIDETTQFSLDWLMLYGTDELNRRLKGQPRVWMYRRCYRKYYTLSGVSS